MAGMSSLHLLGLLVSGVAACKDFDSFGCKARAKLPGFCQGEWGNQNCCSTCAEHKPLQQREGCIVPKQKCVAWSCKAGTRQAVGVSCVAATKDSRMCQRCSVVDSETCAPFKAAERKCQADGTWSGPEPSCRRFCDSSYVPPEDKVEKEDIPLTAELFDPPTFEPLDIDAPPFGDFLKKEKLNKYMAHRFDMWGHWPVMYTAKCASKYGTKPGVHVANQYAQWIDWKGTGQPNNPEVWAALKRYNATMVMFKTADSKAMDDFFDHYQIDEQLDKSPFHPHDVECDETPSSEDGYDNAYCETLQQVFNMGYRAVFPDVFMDKKGSLVANAMDELIGDCGHAYDKTFKYPHCTGKYHYSDKTCEYDCLLSEYEYWALTTYLGGQDGKLVPPKDRCHDISDEWEQCTKEKLEQNDPAIVKILTDPKYNLPMKLPVGKYSPGPSQPLSADIVV